MPVYGQRQISIQPEYASYFSPQVFACMRSKLAALEVYVGVMLLMVIWVNFPNFECPVV